MSVAKHFQKKPVVVEAMQLYLDTFDDVIGWLLDHDALFEENIIRCDIVLLTLEGKMRVRSGDWIIKGVEGEFYPCKPAIFDKTYELVEGNEEQQT